MATDQQYSEETTTHPPYPVDFTAEEQGVHEYIEWWVTVGASGRGGSDDLHLPKPGSTREEPQKCCHYLGEKSLQAHDIAVFPPDSDGNPFHSVCLECLAVIADGRLE